MATSYADLVCSAEELYMLTEDTGLKLEQPAGVVMNPLAGNWALSTSKSITLPISQRPALQSDFGSRRLSQQ